MKKLNLSTWISHLAILVLITTCAQAESTPAKPAVNPSVNIQFSTVSLTDDPIKDLYYRSVPEGQPLAVKAPSFARSGESFKYTGPKDMHFYNLVEKDGKKLPVEVATVTLPTSTPNILLVIAGTAGNYAIGAVDDSVNGFPAGKARLCNATAYKISVKVNDKDTIELAPGAAKVVAGTPQGDLGVEVSYWKDGQYEMATSNAYDVHANERLTLFFLTSDNNKRFLYPRAVQIFPMVEKPKKNP